MPSKRKGRRGKAIGVREESTSIIDQADQVAPPPFPSTEAKLANHEATSSQQPLIESQNVAIAGGQFNHIRGHYTHVVLNVNPTSENTVTIQGSPFGPVPSNETGHISPGPPSSQSTQPNHERTSPLARTEVNQTIFSQKSNDIYERHFMLKGRGFPLWVPDPSQVLHLDYRRTGVRIGDVGIITPGGGFSFLFNICLPHDHPVNSRALPEHFAPISPPIEANDIDIFSIFKNGSHLASASIKRSPQSTAIPGTGSVFESSALEGAILITPRAARSEDLINVARFREYAEANVAEWYKFVNGPRGREVKNGDVRLVCGFDKTTSWGMATFVNHTQQNGCRLKFGPLEGDSSAYTWLEISGVIDARAGPDSNENDELRIGSDPPDFQFENQCLFVRTLNITLADDVWVDIHSTLGSVHVDPRHVRDHSASGRPPSSSASTGGGSNLSPSPGAQYGTQRATGSVCGLGNVDLTTVNNRGIFISGPPGRLTAHPSKPLNDMLLAKFPTAKMAITHDDDWSSIITQYDSTLVDPYYNLSDVAANVLASRKICEEDGVVFLQEKVILNETPSQSDTPIPIGHPNRSVFNNLAVLTQYDQLGGVVNLDEEITYKREALSLCPIGHPDRPTRTCIGSIRGVGYRIHPASHHERLVAIKTFEGPRAKQDWTVDVAFSKEFLHSNVLKVEGVFDERSKSHFVLYRGIISEQKIQSLIGKALRTDLNMSVQISMKAVKGIAAGLSYIKSQNIPMYPGTMNNIQNWENFNIFTSYDDEPIISFHPSSTVHENGSVSQTFDDEIDGRGVEVLSVFCRQLFSGANFILNLYDDSPEREFDVYDCDSEAEPSIVEVEIQEAPDDQTQLQEHTANNRSEQHAQLQRLRELVTDPLSSTQTYPSPTRPYDEDNWEMVPSNLVQRHTDKPERLSPTIWRGPDISRPRITSPYSRRNQDIINNPPTRAPPTGPSCGQEIKITTQTRPARLPLKHDVFVTWNGDEVGNRIRFKSASIPSSGNRLGKNATKSMDNSKISPSSRRNLPITRPLPPLPPPPGAVREYTPSTISYSGVPKSSEPPRYNFISPLPSQGSSYGTSPDVALGPSLQYSSQTYSSNILSPSQEPLPRSHSATEDEDTLSPTTHSYTRHQHGPTLELGESNLSLHPASPPSHRGNHSPGILGSRPRPSTHHSDRSDRSSDIQGDTETPQTPSSPHRYNLKLSPLSPTTPTTGSRSSDATLKQEDHVHFANLLDQMAQDVKSHVVPQTQSEPEKLSQQLTPQSLAHKSSGLDYYDEEDEPDDGDDIWIPRPDPAKASRPPLKVQIGSAVSEIDRRFREYTSSSHLNATVVPNQPPSTNARPGSTWTSIDADSDSWDPRPPPENIYDRLDQFFSKHDLDKLVIEAISGDTSPTAELAIPANHLLNDKGRIKAKKSIRIVAEEHMKRIGLVNAATFANNPLRKRNTKLWGSKPEEATTYRSNSTPESSSSGPSKATFKWVRGELIGQGTYGKVYLALNATTGEMIAVKQVELPRTASDKNDNRQHTIAQALKMEGETLKDLHHPNIVQYLGFEETPSNLSIFLEYVPGGSIGRCLHMHGKFDNNVTRSFTAQILSGLEYLHSKGILHRNLKADNILVEMTGTCKISDFGISKRAEDIVHGGAFTAMQGTIFWMAPEVVHTQKKGYNFKIDIWSVGCVVLEMWAGLRPWMGEETVAVMYKLFQSKLPPPVPDDIVLGEDALDFKQKCFAVNPEERPTATELRKHPYLLLPSDWEFTGFT